MKAECPDQIFVLQQLRQISKQVEAENGRRANLVVWSSTCSTHRQLVIDCRPGQKSFLISCDLLENLCEISASSAPLRFTCFSVSFTAEAQRTQRFRRV